jgi:signal peptide peptidase SppA
MKYMHIVSYVREAVWGILPSKMEDILAVLAFRSAGDTLSADEIRARIGDGRAGVAVVGAGRDRRASAARRHRAPDGHDGGIERRDVGRAVHAHGAAGSRGSGVTAIVLDVDSPGGTVNGVSEAADAVFQARQQKPVVALANGYMASAAYWIASQATELSALPSLLEPSIGSIGVYTVHQDLSAALEKAGVKPTIISAGKYKTEGNPFEPLSDERRAILQASIDKAYAQFVAAVARGRGVDESIVRDGYGEGRALASADARRAGLVDRLATMDDTLARLSSPQIRGKMMSGVRASIEEEAQMMAGMPSMVWAPAASSTGLDEERSCESSARLSVAAGGGRGRRLPAPFRIRLSPAERGAWKKRRA